MHPKQAMQPMPVYEVRPRKDLRTPISSGGNSLLEINNTKTGCGSVT
jgi:hypothetical protein